jgi:hypothetical protein
MNHAGTLCGGCKYGFSMSLGTNMCLSCKNNRNLGLITFFAIAGVFLVVFIKLLNLTVSQGTINGLIFYANIVWAYQDILFPKKANSHWFICMRIFIAWLNLDLGIKSCFVKGMSNYAKTWMQFMFPVYIWSIAGVMVIAAHYSTTMTKLFGSNCVQVLGTLLLLSYVKLLRAIITALVPATLSVYVNDSANPIDVKLVWAFDGNLSYCGNPHGFLFVAALLILLCLWVPYTVILLTFRIIIKHCSNIKYLKWINRLVPFFEPYFGPLKTSQFYWVGLLLVVRGILLIVLTLTYTTTPSASLLCLIIILTILFVTLVYTGRVYQNWLLSLLECSFMVNLQVLGATILFIDLEQLSDTSKEVIMSTSAGIVFVQFLCITFFHLYQFIRRKISRKCNFMQRNVNVATEEVNYYDMTLMDNTDGTKCGILETKYLEDYAVNVDIATH